MRDETFSVTDNRATAVDTFPQTKSGPSETAAGEGVNRNLSMAESMLQQSQMLDPSAGNSVVTYLNQGLRSDVTDTIDTVIEKTLRERSRNRRRRDLAGQQEIDKGPNPYQQHGVFEDNKSGQDPDERKTQTESLADSSVYQVLLDDLGAVKEYATIQKHEQ